MGTNGPEAQASVGTSGMHRAEPAWTTPHCTPGKLVQLPTIPPILALILPLCQLLFVPHMRLNI